MANRLFNQFQYSLEKNPTHIWGKFAIGASGAATISTANSKGIASITRNGAGDYTVLFNDKWTKFLGMDVTFQSSTGLPTAPVWGVKALGTNNVSVRFVTTTVGAGAATDPGDGETMYLHFIMGNSAAL